MIISQLSLPWARPIIRHAVGKHGRGAGALAKKRRRSSNDPGRELALIYYPVRRHGSGVAENMLSGRHDQRSLPLRQPGMPLAYVMVGVQGCIRLDVDDSTY